MIDFVPFEKNFHVETSPLPVIAAQCSPLLVALGLRAGLDLLGHLSYSGDYLLWVGVRRRASSVLRRALTSFQQLPSLSFKNWYVATVG